MILQELLFPNVDTSARRNMFFKGEHFTAHMEDLCCNLSQDAVLSTHTYFNSFSIGKWKKYTVLENLQVRLILQGEFTVRVRHVRKMKGKLKDKIVAERWAVAEKRQEVRIELPTDEDSGIYYLEMLCHSKTGMFFGGAYETRTDETRLPHVKLAIGICTFRREQFVSHNMEVLRQHILENPDSPMYGKLEVFISDNSQTLGNSLDSEHIHVFPNRNLGGSGGFTRAMIEAKKVSEARKITHILMMDDDIRLNPDSLLRTYVMLRLLKPEHHDAFIGGHMLKIDETHIQSEAADHWDIAGHHPVKYNYNLEELNFIVKNEIEDSVNHFGWWYCCMPIDVVSDTNLPLPIFIKRDDIEYGLRNGKTFITLNGICVWHESFEYKYSTYLEYYYFRNMCIMNARHRYSFTAERLIEELWKRVKSFLVRFRYRDAELSLLGIQHYLLGIDWLKKQDGEKLNGAIMKLGYAKSPVDQLDFVFTHGAYEGNLSTKELGRKGKLLKKITLNGWLLPASKTVVVPAYQPDSSLFYRAKKVVNYEEASNTAFITTRDYASLFYILKMYRKTVKLIKRNYARVTREYKDRYDELTNIEFWNKYLFEPGEVPEIVSGLDKPRRPKNSKTQRKQLIMSRASRLLQGLLFWLPVKKNRVMFYVHDRKGLTCNPKYIVQKLKEQYGDKLEIIWATMHPESCREVRELGVLVVKSGSFEQLKLYMRTRFFVTNDSFPHWAMHRWNQKWMNTWHAGMNYKHIGYDYLAPMSRIAAKLFKLQNRQPDFYLSGSRFFTEDTAKSFRFSESIFLPTGLPRNDVFFEERQEISEKVREFYRIDPEKRLAIYAPTFRRGMKSDTYGMNFEQVCGALRERFGGEWVLLFRNHNFVMGKQNYGGAINVSGYEDMQELMCAADVLISDYSSCLYDFCMSKRPAFVYATDLNDYVSNDRSFAYPLEKWPYPIAESNEELLERIRSFDEEAYAQKVNEHLRDAGAYDNGTASEQAAELVAKYCL